MLCKIISGKQCKIGSIDIIDNDMKERKNKKKGRFLCHSHWLSGQFEMDGDQIPLKHCDVVAASFNSSSFSVSFSVSASSKSLTNRRAEGESGEEKETEEEREEEEEGMKEEH